MKNTISISFVIISLTWLFPLHAGEGKRQEPPSPPDLPEQSAPTPSLTIPTDREVCAAVRGVLDSDNSIASRARIEVACHEGILTVSGSADTLQVLRQALGRAGDVRGVLDLVVEVGIRTGDRASPRIALDIREALLGPSFRGDRITVAADSGVVRLVGTTATYARKLLAERTAAEVPGVVEIINELRVAAPPEGDAQALERRISLLLTQGFTRVPGQISVSVHGRTAVLAGRVGLYSHRLRAGRLAHSVGGILRVDNQLEIDPTLPSSLSDDHRVL